MRKLGANRDGLTKIWVELLPEWGWDDACESMWAKPVSRGIVALRNVPFRAYGMSYDDHLRVEVKEGVPTFVEVTRRNGHSTYRVFCSKDRKSAVVNRALERLHREMKCELEPSTERFVAIDVLPAADILRVYEFLEQNERNGLWEFEEAHCGHTVKESH